MKIGGKEYKIRFTVKSIFNLEKELDESLLVTLGRLQNGAAIPLHTVYSLLVTMSTAGRCFPTMNSTIFLPSSWRKESSRRRL